MTSSTTRLLAFETTGLLNQASEPHGNSSRLTSVAPVNFPVINCVCMLKEAFGRSRKELLLALRDPEIREGHFVAVAHR